MTKADYNACLDDAQRICRTVGGQRVAAQDILHDALLVAAATDGRSDLSIPANRAWLAGVMQNLVRMRRRSDVRRSDRGARWEGLREAAGGTVNDAPVILESAGDAHGVRMLDQLSPASRQVAVLLMHDLDRAEIEWILDLTPDSLRQRIRVLRRQLAAIESAIDSDNGSRGDRQSLLARAYSSRRKGDTPPTAAYLRNHLIAIVRRHPGIGMTDPDGHLFVFNTKK